jgi:ACS family glucarate transporter-like MFS transporter
MKSNCPYRYRVLIFLFFLIIITYLDRNCIALVGTRIKAEFHLNNEQFGWVLAAFSLAYALFEFPTGILGDRIGQRAVMIRIVLWWSLFTALTGFTTGLISLIIVRFLFGVGEAGVFPTVSAVISRWLPVTETSRGLSATIIGQAVGLAIAPLFIIPLAGDYGWRSTFFVNAAIGVLWVVLCYLWFRNHPSEMKGISEKEKNYIETNRRFQTHAHSFSLRSALNNQNMRAISGIHFCAQWGTYFFIAWLPVYLIEGRHLSESEMKSASFMIFLAGVISVLFAGFASDLLVRKKGLLFSRRTMGMLALGGGAIGLFINGVYSNNTIAITGLTIAFFLWSINGIVNFSTCVDIGGNYAGAVAGIMNCCGQLGGFMLSLVFGKLAQVTHSFILPVMVVAVILFTGCMLWFFVDPRKQIMVKEPELKLEDVAAA